MLPRKHQQFPLLDAMRALAAIAILVVHATLLRGDVHRWGGVLAHLDIGVAIFFLLSAFLLYRPMVASRRGIGRRTAWPDYARRRFLRVVPAYWAALTVGAIVPGLTGAFSGNWWVYYGLLQNYPVFTPEGDCATNTFRCAIPTAWSLAVELGFYVTLPLWALLLDRLARGRSRGSWIGVELGAIAALSLASVAVQASVPTGDVHRWLFFSPIGRGWWFGLGLALAVASVWIEERGAEPAIVRAVRRRPGSALLLGAGLYLLATWTFLAPGPSLAFPDVGIAEYLAEYLLFGLIAALVLVPGIFGRDGGGLSRRVLGHPVLLWLGLVSYGIFLWQFPVMIFVGEHAPDLSWTGFTLVSLAGTIACAALSYYLVERPLMRWGRRGGEVRAEAAPAAG